MSIPLNDLLDDLLCPTVVKITKGRLDVPNWRSFGEGKCVTIFPPSQQMLVLNSTSYENVDVNDRSQGDSHSLESLSFLSSKTRQRFHDKHCEGKRYRSISALQAEFPRYLRADEDFFTFVEDDNMCHVHKIAAGQILELYEVHHDHSSEDSDIYQNVRGPDGQILRCRIKEDGVEVMLPNSIKVNLVATEDDTKYTIKDISERFSFPRNLVFSDSAMQTSMTKLRQSPMLYIASETSEKMLLLCEVGRTNIEAYDEKLFQCQDVCVTSMGVVNTSQVSVQCCPGHVEGLDMFRYLYAKRQSTLDNGLPIYCIYGTEDDDADDNGDEDDGDDAEDYTPMKSPDEFVAPVLEKRHSGSSGSSRSSSLRSTKSSLSTRSSRSSGSEIGPGEDHGGSYVHINPDITHTQPSHPSAPQAGKAKSEDGGVKSQSAAHGVTSQPAVTSSSSSSIANRRDQTGNQAASGAAPLQQTTSCEMQNMGISELCEFLNKYKLTTLSNVCENEMIDGELISSLGDEDLKKEPFMLREFELKKFKKLKEGWRPKL